jgi:gliding motility-associated-like protein
VLTFSKTTDPIHGTVVVNSDGSYMYTPNSNYNGSDSFTVTVSDGNGGTNTVTVNVTVTPVNDAPVATATPIVTAEDTPVNGAVTATDVDGDVLTFSKTTDPTHGTVVVNSDGSYTYTPSANYNGIDSFTVTVSDGNGGTNTVTVNVTVTLINHKPVAVDDATESTNEDTVLNGNVSANDSPSRDGGNTWALATNPIHGTATVNVDGTYTYIPNVNYAGNDSFTYVISDKDGDISTATVTISVLALPEIIKTASKPRRNNDGTFSWVYTILLINDTDQKIDSVQVIDNLDNVFVDKGCTYEVTSKTASGQLTANGLYNGSSIVSLLVEGGSIAANVTDTITFEVRVDTHGQKDTVVVFNQATLNGESLNSRFSIKSNSKMNSNKLEPTETDIPEVDIFVPDGFSPNGDGINDKYVITHSAALKIDLEVYNRWGNLVYKSSDYQNEWDGKGMGNLLGQDLPTGTYFCSCKAINLTTGEVVSNAVKYVTLRR